MWQSNIHHALGLHMHQPPGHLKFLIDNNEFEAEQIIRCYERAARYACRFADVGRLHVSFSGVLLEQFQDPEIVKRYRRFIDIPAMLESYRSSKIQMHEQSGFFGHFFEPYLEGVKSGAIPIQPVLLSEYLRKRPPVQAALVGTWIEAASEDDGSRWIRSKTQREAVEAIRNASKHYWTLANLANRTGLSTEARSNLAKARELILESETSCFLVRGDDWVSKVAERINPAEELLVKAEATVTLRKV